VALDKSNELVGKSTLFQRAAKLERDLREYHFSKVVAWWDEHKDDFGLREGAPLSQRQVIGTMPNRTDKLAKALDDYRKIVEQAGTAPR